MVSTWLCRSQRSSVVTRSMIALSRLVSCGLSTDPGWTIRLCSSLSSSIRNSCQRQHHWLINLTQMQLQSLKFTAEFWCCLCDNYQVTSHRCNHTPTNVTSSVHSVLGNTWVPNTAYSATMAEKQVYQSGLKETCITRESLPGEGVLLKGAKYFGSGLLNTCVLGNRPTSSNFTE